jgi:hypothetical protein
VFWTALGGTFEFQDETSGGQVTELRSIEFLTALVFHVCRWL